MKIDKVAGGHLVQSSLHSTPSKTLNVSALSTHTETTLNANIAAIEKAQQDMASLPNVDMAKVDAVRQALQRGELSLDMKALSQAVMQFHTGHE